MEKLSSMKPVPVAKKFGDRCSKVYSGKDGMGNVFTLINVPPIGGCTQNIYLQVVYLEVKT